MKKGSIIAIVVGGVVLLGVLVVIVIAVGIYWFARKSPSPQIVYNDPPAVMSALPDVPAQLDPIAIEVAADGSISLWGETLDHPAFALRLKAHAGENPGQSVCIQADAETLAEHVVKVIDTCRKAGIDEISVATGTPKSAE